RDSLLEQYRGKFVAIVNGSVAAVGDKLAKVSAEAYRKTGSKVKFVTLVGQEDFEFVIRIASGYFDHSSRYDLPIVPVKISDIGTDSLVDAEFVVDTGADISIVMQQLGDELDLWDSPAGFASIRGIGGSAERRA